MTPIVAPGKAMLMGEYGVLFGGTALSMPTKRSAVCTFLKSPQLDFSALTSHLEHNRQHPLFMAVQRACSQQSITTPCGRYVLDTRDFYRGSRKLGFGSSAAAIAALTKTIFFLEKIDNPQLLLHTALLAHKYFADGLGSGADIATSIAGEPIWFKNHGHTPHYEPARLFFIPDVIFIDTGRSQDTKVMVKHVIEFALHHKTYIDSFQKHATRLSETLLTASDIHEVISVIKDFYQLLDQLGQKAYINIISDEHRTIHQLARHYEGAAKPSGSGGGDLALALIPKPHQQDFIDAVSNAGFSPILAP